MKHFFIIAYLCASIVAPAQTKLIHHRSHSGSNESFVATLVQDHNPNLGMAPTHIVKNAKMDSLIFVNDTIAIMVTSLYCRERYETDEAYQKWRAGRDTVRNHPLFSKQHQLDKIKKTIKNDYNFNEINNIIYVGYDNINPPPTIKPNIDNPNKNKNQQQQFQQQQNQQQQQIDETQQQQQSLQGIGAIMLLSIFTIAMIKHKPSNATA
jgi:hypothetical protein